MNVRRGYTLFDCIKRMCNGRILLFLACAVLTACIIIAVVCAVLKGRCSDCNRCLCPAQSKAVTKAPEDFISFELPPNAGITKIYVSLVQNPAAPIDGVEILIIGPLELEFAHWFSKDPLARVGSFETTLVQPLCIGEEGATLLYTTLNQVDATILSITVVYCPDYCAE